MIFPYFTAIQSNIGNYFHALKCYDGKVLCGLTMLAIKSETRGIRDEGERDN